MQGTSFRRSGEITVFLTFLLLLFLGFLCTTLEASGISSVRAYARVTSRMSSDSFGSEYCFPLFDEYGILAVDTGVKEEDERKEWVKDELFRPIEHSFTHKTGGLVKGRDPSVTVNELEGLYNGDTDEFLSQLRDQALLEGVTGVVNLVTGDLGFGTAKVVPEAWDKQADAMEKAKEVTKDLLHLMEIVDGIIMTDNGFDTDEDGKLQRSGSYVKQYGVRSGEYMKNTYTDSAVYEVASSGIYLPEEYALEAIDIIEAFEEERMNFAAASENEQDTNDVGVPEETEGTGNTVNDHGLNIAKSIYLGLQRETERQTDILREALECVVAIISKQGIAEETIGAYKSFLDGIEGAPSGLVDGFVQEVSEMQAYAAFSELDLDMKAMAKELAEDIRILEEFDFAEFDDNEPSEMIGVLYSFVSATRLVSYETMKFTYDYITESKNDTGELYDALDKLSGTGLFTLLGIGNVSDRELTGLELPSGEEKRNESEIPLLKSFSDMCETIRGMNIETMIKEAGRTLSDDAMLEVYIQNHFGNLIKNRSDTMLKYEREYILSGHAEDHTNLRDVICELVALRAVIDFGSIMADSSRRSAAGAMAASLVSWWLPELLYPVKYTIIVAWALEEALVEVSALADGKKVPLYCGTGRVGISELLTVSPGMIEAHKMRITDNAGGISYSEYLTVLSLLKKNEKKVVRILDLIQENIRLKYDDSFRVANCVTGVSYSVNVTAEKRFDTAFFSDEAYRIAFGAKMEF